MCYSGPGGCPNERANGLCRYPRPMCDSGEYQDYEDALEDYGDRLYHEMADGDISPRRASMKLNAFKRKRGIR